MYFLLKPSGMYFLLGFIFFIFASHQSRGAATDATIKKAEEHILNNERDLALKVLASSIELEIANLTKANSKKNDVSKNINELLRAGKKMSRIFISETSQQKYELAQSERAKDPIKASLNLEEILKEEPSHFLVLHSLVSLYLKNKECAKAKVLLGQGLEKFKFDEDIFWLNVFVEAHCGETNKLLVLIKDPVFELFKKQNVKNEQAFVWHFLELLPDFNQQKCSEVLLKIEELKKINPSFIEYSFYIARCGNLATNDKLLTSYHKLCKEKVEGIKLNPPLLPFSKDEILVCYNH